MTSASRGGGPRPRGRGPARGGRRPREQRGRRRRRLGVGGGRCGRRAPISRSTSVGPGLHRRARPPHAAQGRGGRGQRDVHPPGHVLALVQAQHGRQGALASVTGTLRLELAPYGVHVVEVIPVRSTHPTSAPPGSSRHALETLQGRLGLALPEEVAAQVVAAIRHRAERWSSPPRRPHDAAYEEPRVPPGGHRAPSGEPRRTCCAGWATSSTRWWSAATIPWWSRPRGLGKASRDAR